MQITFKPMTEEHLELMTNWLNRAHLQKWWRKGLIDIDEVRQKYLPRIYGKDNAHPFLFFLNKEPLGFIQYYSVSDGDPNWWPDKPGPGVLGIDQFIADEENLNRGTGTLMIIRFILLLMKDKSVREIRVDPNPDNARAIRCYEKVGFVRKGLITTPDGRAIMMTLDRKSFLKKMRLTKAESSPKIK